MALGLRLALGLAFVSSCAPTVTRLPPSPSQDALTCFQTFPDEGRVDTVCVDTRSLIDAGSGRPIAARSVQIGTAVLYREPHRDWFGALASTCAHAGAREDGGRPRATISIENNVATIRYAGTLQGTRIDCRVATMASIRTAQEMEWNPEIEGVLEHAAEPIPTKNVCTDGMHRFYRAYTPGGPLVTPLCH